ncbi:MAG: MFS transporter [Clostridia bacterium]|nr:MFS transporter [Clostridia bacterium]
MHKQDTVKNANKVNRVLILFVASLGLFISPFMVSAVNVILRPIEKEFGMNAILLNWVATSYLLAAAVFLVPFGRLADIYGRKKMYVLGIAIFTAASLLCAISQSSAMFISFRAVQGLGSAMILGTGVAILTSAFPAEERGRVLGISVAVVYLGLSLGPFLGGILTNGFGWRSIFLVNVPFGVAAVLFALYKLKGQEWAEARGEKFDLTGSLIYGISLSTIMYGFSMLPRFLGYFLIALGMVGILIFGIYEAKIKSPVLNTALFLKNKVFLFSCIATLINYSATFAVGYLLSLYLQYAKDFDSRMVGIILVVQPVVQVIFSPLAGKFSDKKKPQIIASMGMVLTTLGLFPLIFLSKDTSLLFIMGCLIILGLGLALFSSPNTNAIMTSVERKFYGVASGIIGTMRLVGQMLSMGIVTLVFALYIGKVQIGSQNQEIFVNSMKLIFIILTVFSFVGIFTSLARNEKGT